ncbi:GDSL-type esterase/lipase family protein [Mucilaginibacter sp. AW1-3]
MKQTITRHLFLSLCLSLFITITLAQSKIKVACVGNSITFGYGLKPGEAYPTILQQLLGDQYEVSNYGISARTLLRKGDHPYWNEAKYKEVLALNPDIVIIKLGTNDTKPQNWAHKEDFVQDYEDFIESFKTLPSHPKIYVCTPFPIFPNKFNIRDSILTNEMLPDLKTIISKEKVKTIDLYHTFAGQANLVFDGVHPNKEGSALLAKKIYEAIK